MSSGERERGRDGELVLIGTSRECGFNSDVTDVEFIDGGVNFLFCTVSLCDCSNTSFTGNMEI